VYVDPRHGINHQRAAASDFVSCTVAGPPNSYTLP
jgi:hypothetical protein